MKGNLFRVPVIILEIILRWNGTPTRVVIIMLLDYYVMTSFDVRNRNCSINCMVYYFRFKVDNKILHPEIAEW